MFKNIMLCFLLVIGLSAFLSQNAMAQNNVKVSCKKKNDIHCLKGQEVLFISGMVKDIATKTLLSGKELHFANSGSGVLYANITATGHYAIAIDKEALEGVSNLAIQIEGYDTFVLGNIDASTATYLNRDLYLQTLATIKPIEVEVERAGLNESPDNPFILRF